MIKIIVKNHRTQEIISEKMVADNWWDVYLRAARADGRRIVYHSAYTYPVIYTEKNRVYTFVR